MRVTIYSGLTREIIGTPIVTSMTEARMFLASELPEHYFGAQLVSDTGTTVLIAVKDAYDEDCTAIQAAIDSLVCEVKRLNGMFNTHEDEEGVVYKYWRDITAEQLLATTAIR